MNFDAILALIQSPIMRRTALYWAEKRGTRAMPSRQDIEPLEMREALGFISLIDIERDPYRFFFRLDGSKQVELFQIDCTGRYLDECFDEQHLNVAQKSYRLAADTGEIGYYRRQLPYHERIIAYEIVILPLGESDHVQAGEGAVPMTLPNKLMTAGTRLDLITSFGPACIAA